MTDLPREHWNFHVKAHLEKLISDAVCTGQGGGGIATGPGKDAGPGAWSLGLAGLAGFNGAAKPLASLGEANVGSVQIKILVDDHLRVIFDL